LGERVYRPVAASRLIAAGSAASKSRPSCERLIPVGLLYTMGSVTTAAGSARRTTRCRAPVPIRVPEYRLRHGHPQTDGCWRDPSGRQWDACRPTSGRFVVVAPAGTMREQMVPRRVVVGNLGYDVSFTRPKSYSLLLAFRPRGHCRRRGGRLHRGGGRTFGWLEASAPTGCAATTATARARPRWPRGGSG